MTITVSTDGSALGNPNGPMGWAWADHDSPSAKQQEHQHPSDCDAGGATNGTNQIGELCAVLEALRAHPGSEPLIIETDSQYAINCVTTWIKGWKRNGWKNSQKKPVKNAELIKAIDTELSKRPGSVKFVWVKGHAGNAGNEKVDQLARTYAADCRSGAKDGYLPREGWQSLIASEYSSGLDVPSDAQLLLDGSIDDADYHRGHHNASATDFSATSRSNVASQSNRSAEFANSTDLLDDTDSADHADSRNHVGNYGNADDYHGAGNHRDADDSDNVAGSTADDSGTTTPLPFSKKPAVAALLAEPEGVPDYPFAQSHNDRSSGFPSHDAHQTDPESAANEGESLASHSSHNGSLPHGVFDSDSDSESDDSLGTTTVLPVATHDDDDLANNATTDGDDSETTIIPRPRLGGMRSVKDSGRANTSDKRNAADGETTLIFTAKDNTAAKGDTAKNSSKSSRIITSGHKDSHKDDVVDETAVIDAAVTTVTTATTAETAVADKTDVAGHKNNTDETGAGGYKNNANETPTSSNPAPSHHRSRSGSGLTVSGTLRFSPPPQSSPTYNGKPRFIRGTVTVEGYVQGDGTIVLDDADFTVHRA